MSGNGSELLSLLLVVAATLVGVLGLFARNFRLKAASHVLPVATPLDRDPARLLPALLDSMPDRVWLKDPEGVYLYCNSSFGELCGTGTLNLIGRTDFDCFDPALAELFRVRDRETLLGGVPVVDEEWLTPKNGDEPGLFQTVKAPVRRPDGTPIGVLGVAREISKLRDAQTVPAWRRPLPEAAGTVSAVSAAREDHGFGHAARELSPDRFEAMVGNAMEPMLLLDSETMELLEFNEAACAALGYERAELCWLRLPEVLEQPDEPAVREVLRGAMPGGHIQADWRLRRKDAELRSWRVSGKALSLGGRACLALTATDVTASEAAERQRAEEFRRVRESEERFALAVEATNDGIWDWDLATNHTFCNHAYFRMLGYEPEELPEDVQSRWINLLHPEDRTAVLETVRKILTSGADETEFRMRTVDGSYKWILSRGKVVGRDDAGRPARVAGTHTDVTERKEMELELREAKERAQAGNVAKSTFLANISHEVRTPMNAILGFSHLLARQLTQPQQLDKLNKISTAARQLLGIIDDVLDFSNIESGELRLQESRFNVVALLADVQSNVAERAQAKGLRLEQEYDPRLATLTLLGDRARIGQVLLNFVANAIKFTEHGQVSVRVVIESEVDESVTLRFDVQDTGIGLSEEQQSRIFEVFEQGQNSLTRKYGGTGLGLAISRSLARRMGGDTGVVSAPGEGSTFWLRVGLRRGDAAGSEIPGDPQAVAAPLREGARVLVVEDNGINQQVAVSLLHGMGLRAEVAKDGAEAIARVERDDYDLILMDMQMPVMGGLEATRRIRSLEGGRTVPILALTANVQEADRQRCFEAGMNGHLVKPVDPVELRMTLARWIAVQPGSAGAAPADRWSGPTAERQLDREAGLRFFAGDWSQYRDMLSLFAATHAGDAVSLRAALQQGDTEVAARIAHTLKGHASMLASDRLRGVAWALEQGIRAGADPDALAGDIDTLDETLSSLSAEIRRIGLEPAASTVS